MPGTPITGSVNISLLDEKIAADLCAGKFYIDASPSNFLGSGASNVLGIKVKVINPAGAIIKDYGSGYDAAPAFSGGVVAPVSVNVPTRSGKFQYGVYTFSLQLTDAGGQKYEVTKTQNICAYPDEATVCQDAVQMIANCQDGTLTVLMAEPVTYQGRFAFSKTQSWKLYYPTASGLDYLPSTVGNFNVRLFEGVYKLIGSVCVTYSMGDNVFISLGFNGNWEKDVKCVLDYSCIYPQISKLGEELESECSDQQKSEVSSVVFEVLWLLKKIEITLASGEDAGDDISNLEKLLGCSCTCDCSTASPIINNTPSTSFLIEGCGIQKETVGLTDHYTINNYEYIVDVDPAQSFITVSAPSLTDCVKTQRITLDVVALYANFQQQMNTSAQYSFYAALINNYLIAVDPTCLNLTGNQWNALSLAQKIQAIIGMACQGGSCPGTATATVAKSGADVILTLAITNAYSADIYVDGILAGNVLAAVTSFTIPDVADGNTHAYQIIPRCANGQMGISFIDSFQYIACPQIEPLTVSSNNVNGADCPYNLNSLVSGLPAGITAEWHTANNTNASSLVANPTAVSSGNYYGFAKNAAGCYSIGIQVILICAAASDCSAPQNLQVVSGTSGVIISFDGAAFPPPANSYTVKFRPASLPDVDGSYTTVGTPSFNATSGKWEIAGSFQLPYLLYYYKAQSNCSSTTPSVQTPFAYGACNNITRTIAPDSIILSVAAIPIVAPHKLVFDLYDASGNNFITTTSLITSNSVTRTATFFYLTPSTNYVIKVSMFTADGTYKISNCSTIAFTTETAVNINIENNIGALILTNATNSGSPFFTPTTGAFPLGDGDSIQGKAASFSGSIFLSISGTPAGDVRAGLFINGVLQECINIDGSGSNTFSFAYFSASDQMDIILLEGTDCAP